MLIHQTNNHNKLQPASNKKQLATHSASDFYDKEIIKTRLAISIAIRKQQEEVPYDNQVLDFGTTAQLNLDKSD